MIVILGRGFGVNQVLSRWVQLRSKTSETNLIPPCGAILPPLFLQTASGPAVYSWSRFTFPLVDSAISFYGLIYKYITVLLAMKS